MNTSTFRPLLRFLPVGAAFLAAGCAPTIDVAVPKPVVIDVNMKVDVTSRNVGPAAAKPGTVSVAADPSATPDGAAQEHTLISGEVQSLKNTRLVGEDNHGYLDVRQTPSGKLADGEDYAAYVQRVVKEEDDARRVLDLQTASKEGVPLQTIEAESAKRWQDAAFPGEWIQDADGTWKQK